jgi:hypothetical protein
MAAPKGKDKMNELFDEAIVDISENGKSAISALKGRMSTLAFYKLLEEDEEKQKRYARACEMRAEQMANELLEIADTFDNDVHLDKDGNEIINHNVINRDRLRVDSRKWLLAKLHPKKYGDKIEHEHSGSINLHFDSDDSKA